MYVSVPEESSAEGEVAEWYRAQRDSWGYLPNYAAAFALRPDVADAWNALNGAIRTNMERRRYELATIAAARAYRSTYCMAAHSKFLRDDCDDEEAMRALAADPSGGSLDEADRAVVALATKVAQDATSVTAADVEALRACGLADEDIVDVVMAAAARGFFTKVVDALGAETDAQLGAAFDDEVRRQVTVGRPIAERPSR